MNAYREVVKQIFDFKRMFSCNMVEYAISKFPTLTASSREAAIRMRVRKETR